MRCIKTLALLFMLWPLLIQAQDVESWIRIDRPDADLRTSLPPEAIDYGTFIWMPASLAPRSLESTQFQRVNRPFDLKVHGQSIDPLDGLPGADQPGRAVFSGEADFHLVQFRGPIRREWLLELEQRGLEAVQYMAPFIYIVWGHAEQLPRPSGRADDPVRFAGILPPAMRFAKADPNARSDVGTSLAMIYGPAQDRIRADLASAGAVILDVAGMGRDFSVITLAGGPERYRQLAEIPGVLALQPADFEPAPRGEMGAQSVVGAYDQNNNIFPGYPAWLAQAGLSGEGVIVSVVDERIRQTHLDLEGQFLDCQPLNAEDPQQITSCDAGGPPSRRGTHVASGIAGTAASGREANGFLRGHGVAPGASLVSQLWTPFADRDAPGGLASGGLQTIFAESALSGAVLSNHSWGLRSVPQGYDIPTRAIDVLVRDALPDVAGQQSVAAVWAIYNGNGDRNFGQCQPSSLGTPEEAKNLLAVSASNLQTSTGAQLSNIFDISSGSAHGPACDGRLVPQIVAPGCHIDGPSAGSDENYERRCGTSYAAPLVTGAAALFVEQFRRDHAGADPSPAIIRAMLTVSARDLVGNRDADSELLGHRPDRKQGWGRLDLDAVINPPGHVLIDQPEVLTASGEPWRLRVAPENPALPVRIMLAWTDAPGTAMASVSTNPVLINDLDLIVEVNGQRYRGNQFGGDGFSVSSANTDTLNNLEGVFLSPTQHGWQEIEIEVLAADLSADALNPWAPEHANPRQDFALVCYNCRTEPDFSLTVDPSPVTVCLDSAGDGQSESTLQAEALLGFVGDIDLGQINVLPVDSGVRASASPTDLRPGGTSTLTVVAEDASDSNNIQVLLQAAPSAAPDAGREIKLPVRLLSELELPPGLLAPADQALGVNLLPAFSWETVGRAQHYRFELATSSNFAEATILVDEVLSDTEYQLRSRLSGNTEHYWRVTASNDCGPGSVSSTGQFTTGTNTPVQMSLTFAAPAETLASASALPPVTIADVIDIEGRPADEVLVRLALRALSGSGWLEGELIRPTVNGEVVFDDLVIRSDFGGTFELVATIVRDEVLPLPETFQLSGGQFLVHTVAGGITRGGAFKGLLFRGNYTGIIQGNISQPGAASLRMDITSPDGQTFAVGGDDEKATAEDWNFQNGETVSDGFFSSEHPDAFPSDTDIVGLWTVRFTHDFRDRSPMLWDGVEVVLLEEALEQVSSPFTVEGRLIFQDRFEPETQ